MFRKVKNHCYGQKSPEDIYKQVSVTKCPTKISESQVSHSKDTSYTTIPKTFILLSQERKGSLLWTEVRTSRWNSLEKRTIKKDRTDHSGNSRSQERRAQSRHSHRNLQSCSCDIGWGSGIADENKERCWDGDRRLASKARHASVESERNRSDRGEDRFGDRRSVS